MPSDREYDAIEELTAVSQVNKQTRGQPRAAPPRLRSQDVSLACRGPKTRAFARRSGDCHQAARGRPKGRPQLSIRPLEPRSEGRAPGIRADARSIACRPRLPASGGCTWQRRRPCSHGRSGRVYRTAVRPRMAPIRWAAALACVPSTSRPSSSYAMPEKSIGAPAKSSGRRNLQTKIRRSASCTSSVGVARRPGPRGGPS